MIGCVGEITEDLCWGFYIKFRNNTGMHYSLPVMQVDYDNAKDPALRRLIAWRMGDPRVIRGE